MEAGSKSEGGAGLGMAVEASRFGAVGLVERGGVVVLLVLADDREAAEREVVEALPDVRPGQEAARLAREVASRIETGEGFDGIPFEVSGTGFQEEVWSELLRVGRGEVVTYGELAERIGRPRAARAIGAACGANAVALLVPCHRVVGSGNEPGGYRWGVGRKLALLEGEGVTVRDD